MTSTDHSYDDSSAGPYHDEEDDEVDDGEEVSKVEDAMDYTPVYDPTPASMRAARQATLETARAGGVPVGSGAAVAAEIAIAAELERQAEAVAAARIPPKMRKRGRPRIYTDAEREERRRGRGRGARKRRWLRALPPPRPCPSLLPRPPPSASGADGASSGNSDRAEDEDLLRRRDPRWLLQWRKLKDFYKDFLLSSGKTDRWVSGKLGTRDRDRDSQWVTEQRKMYEEYRNRKLKSCNDVAVDRGENTSTADATASSAYVIKMGQAERPGSINGAGEGVEYPNGRETEGEPKYRQLDSNADQPCAENGADNNSAAGGQHDGDNVCASNLVANGAPEAVSSRDLVGAKIRLLDSIHFVWNPIASPPPPSAYRPGACPDSEEWDDYYLQLREYVRTRGDTLVPDHVELGTWAMTQRLRHRRGVLSAERVTALREVGFDFDGDDECRWHVMFRRLREFKDEWGDCLVMPPGRFHGEEDPDNNDGENYEELVDGTDRLDLGEKDEMLSRWVMRQRIEKKFYDKANAPVEAAAMGETSTEQLEGIQEPRGDFGDVDDFREQDITNTSVGNGATKSRVKKGKRGSNSNVCNGSSSKTEDVGHAVSYLTPQHIQDLDSLGFIWDMDITPGWIQNYRRMCAFRKENGHCRATKGTACAPLYNWVKKVRGHYKMLQKGGPNNLTPDKMRLLESIGFVFEIEDLPTKLGWDQRYEMLREFRAQNGHCVVPQRHPLLGEWVKKMRQAYVYRMRGLTARPGMRLSDEKMAKLEALGFVWRVQPGRTPKKHKGEDFSPPPGRKMRKKTGSRLKPGEELEDEWGGRDTSAIDNHDLLEGKDNDTNEEEQCHEEEQCPESTTHTGQTDGEGRKRERPSLDWVRRKGSSRRDKQQHFSLHTAQDGPDQPASGSFGPRTIADLGPVAVPAHEPYAEQQAQLQTPHPSTAYPVGPCSASCAGAWRSD